MTPPERRAAIDAGSAAVDELLHEQIAYYRARAPEYCQTAGVPMPSGTPADAHRAAIDALRALPHVEYALELACGPGTWTPELLRQADHLTAIDSSPEMLALAARNVRSHRVRFIEANLFEWSPDRRYQLVFFGFWLSHVPLARFGQFWRLVDRCLARGGRVAFVDDGYRSAEELIDGEQSEAVLRRLLDGTPHRAIKVPHTPSTLGERLARLGWSIDVRPLLEPIFIGIGTRTGD